MVTLAAPWWREKAGPDVARAVAAAVEGIRRGASHQRHVQRAIAHRTLYEDGSQARAFGGSTPDLPASMQRGIEALTQGMLSINVLRSVVDTATALVGARSRPKPSFMTSGGTFAERDRTMLANRHIEAVMRDGRAHEIALRAFRDACLDDCGFVRVFVDGGRVRFERVDALTVMVSAIEGRNESPRTLYTSDIVDRGTLSARFPRSRRAIDEAPDPSFDDSDPPEWREEQVTASDVVRVYEAWRLPSVHGAKDGRHVIAIDNETILDEPWTRDRFPIVAFRWSSRTAGFWGFSLAEEVAPLQRRITDTATKIKRSLDRCAVARVWVPRGANPTSSPVKLSRTIGEIVEYGGGQPPTFDVGEAVGPEVFAHMQWLISQAYEVSGVSRMSATSQKPAGLSSGEAIREYNDLAADRAMAVSRAWESFFSELAHVTVDTLADPDAAEAEYVPTDRDSDAVRWRDVELDRDRCVIVVHPTSMLARDFSARYQQLSEMVQAGFIDVPTAKAMTGMPDIDRELDLETAPRKIVEMAIDRMMRTRVYQAPDPRMDLAFAAQRARDVVMLEEMRGADPDDVGLDLVRMFGEAARTMLESSAAPPAAPQMAAPAPMAGEMSADPLPAGQGAGGMIQ